MGAKVFLNLTFTISNYQMFKEWHRIVYNFFQNFKWLGILALSVNCPVIQIWLYYKLWCVSVKL